MTESHFSFWTSTNVWYSFAVIGFFVVCFLYVRKPLLGWLDGEILKVREELERAKKLRAEAAATLEDYRRRQQAAMQEAEAIVAGAKRDAAHLRAAAEAELKQTLERHEQKALDRIRQAEADVVEEVRAAVIAEAVGVAREALAKQIDAKAAEKLTEKAIAEALDLASAKTA